jgi:hypothetical protein
VLPSGIRRWPNKSVENFHRTRRRIRTRCVASTNEISRVANGTRVCQPFIEFTRLRRSYEQFFRLAAGRRPLRHAIPKRHPPSRGLRLSRLSRGELAALLAVPLVEEELGIHALGRPLRVLLGLLDACAGRERGWKGQRRDEFLARVRENPENPRARRRKPDASAQSRRMRPGARRERFRRHLTEPDHAVAGPRGPARPAEAAPSWRTPHGYTRHTAARPGKNLVAGSS